MDRIDPLDCLRFLNRLDIEIDDHRLVVAPHQEKNSSTDETLERVLVRSEQQAVVVNIHIEPVERPEEVRWIVPIHRHG